MGLSFMKLIKKQVKFNGQYFDKYYFDELNKSVKKSPLEEIEQKQLVANCKIKYKHLFKCMLHPVNESKSKPQYRAKLPMLGLNKGASDWLVLVSNKKYGFLVIELKRSRLKDSSVSIDQKEFIHSTKEHGGYGCVCYGYKAALEVMEMYFNNLL